MASSSLARAVAIGTAVLGVLAVAACNDRYGRYDARDCDYTYRQCRTYCDYWCDGWGCYPTCYDRCWTECGSDGRSDRDRDRADEDYDYPTSSSTSSTSTSGAPAPIATDGGVPVLEPNPGTGVLCTSCSANSDCESGALCILRGGPPRDAGSDGGAPAGRGFCGHACTTSADCPDGFLCSQLGTSRQCLPTAGSCQ